MKRLAIMLLCSTLCSAQSIQGGATAQGNVQTAFTQNSTSLMGLTGFNQTFGELTTVLNAMQFTYSQFAQKAVIPNAEADGCAVVSGTKIYLIGGYAGTASTPLNNVQIYDTVADSWSQGATIPTSEWGAGCALYNGSIYVFGGVNSSSETPTTNAYAYSIAGNSWATLTALPSACADGLMANTVGSFIYLMYKGTVWQFDPAGAGGAGSYTAKTTGPTVVWAATGYINVSGDDRIYYLGGSNNAGTYYNTVYYYSITNNSWSSSISTTPYTAHGMAQNAMLNGMIYYGGGYDGSQFYRDIYSYNPTNNTWSSIIVTMNAFRDGVGGQFVGPTLYLMGGRNASSLPFGMVDNESFAIGSIPSSITLTKIRLHFTQASPSGSVEMGIYADSGGLPGALILDAGNTPVLNGWTTISGQTINLTPGTKYWLAFIESVSNGVDYTAGYAFNTVSNHSRCTAPATYGALPGTFPSAGRGCSVTATYGEQVTQ